jgi:hypothetical protein
MRMTDTTANNFHKKDTKTNAINFAEGQVTLPKEKYICVNETEQQNNIT